MNNDLPKGCIKEKEWHGNSSLGLISYVKEFKIPATGRNIPVYVFGKFPKITFCVSAGANSDYSYSDCFYPEKLDFLEFMKKVDEKYKKGDLIK